MKPRAIHFVSAVLIGLGIGVFLYRFGVLGLFWQSSLKWVFPAVGAGLLAGGFKMQSLDTESERPAISTRIALALVGIGAAMGLLYLAVPSLARTHLERRELPGFSIEAPTGKPYTEVIDYATGTLTWNQVGGSNAVLTINWQTGHLSSEDLELGMKALAGEIGGTPQRVTMPGPNGTSVETMKVDTDKDVPAWLSIMPCGNRGMIVMTMGVSGSDELHRRVLKSFVCKPDAAKENVEPGTVRVAIQLPGWWVDEREVGQLTVTDGKAIIIIREISAQQDKLPELVATMLNAFGGNMKAKPRIGDRVPFSGTLEGEEVEGWARSIQCPTHGVLVMALANTHEDSEAAYVASANAGCLRPGEAPPVFPDAPAEEAVDPEPEGDAEPEGEAAPAPAE